MAMFEESTIWAMSIDRERATERPYDDATYGIVDEDEGGIIAYVHHDSIDRMCAALRGGPSPSVREALIAQRDEAIALQNPEEENDPSQEEAEVVSGFLIDSYESSPASSQHYIDTGARLLVGEGV